MYECHGKKYYELRVRTKNPQKIKNEMNYPHTKTLTEREREGERKGEIQRLCGFRVI